MDKDRFALETEIHNSDDLIEARRERPSPEDEFDEELVHPPDDIDPNVDLTFPHPRSKHEAHADLEPIDRPSESDMDEDWDAQDLQPTDYEHKYNEATDAHASDDEDEIAEEHIHEIGHVSMDDVDDTPTELLQHNFIPDEESAALALKSYSEAAMFTIQGTSIKPGVAVAVAAVVDSMTGINGVYPSILEEGLTALKRHSAPADYPEAVIACDMLAMGVSIRVPGINTIAVIAQSDAEIPGLEPEGPCVIGLPDLLQSISEGDIVIVDGGRGVVHIDPDPQTLVYYQEIENRHAGATVYITSEHIPARTQDGHVVYVHARISNEAELQAALDEGADGLFVETWGSECYGSVLRAAAGKHVAFVVDDLDATLFHAAAELSVPHQVSVLFQPADLDSRLAEAALIMEIAAQEARQADLAPPHIAFGVRAEARECAQMPKPAPLATDQGDDLDLAGCLLGRTDPESVLVLVGEPSEALEPLVSAGARSVVVSPGMIRLCKDLIKTVGAEF